MLVADSLPERTKLWTLEVFTLKHKVNTQRANISLETNLSPLVFKEYWCVISGFYFYFWVSFFFGSGFGDSCFMEQMFKIQQF